MPADNLYQGFGIPFDPEGLLSTCPAVVNVIAGYFAGLVLLLLAGLVLEIAKSKKWAYFFEAFGKNPLSIYILSGLLIKNMMLIRINENSLKSLRKSCYCLRV